MEVTVKKQHDSRVGPPGSTIEDTNTLGFDRVECGPRNENGAAEGFWWGRHTVASLWTGKGIWVSTRQWARKRPRVPKGGGSLRR
jgi:hypothetical protein